MEMRVEEKSKELKTEIKHFNALKTTNSVGN
jgi:hypothetical protein